METEQVVPGGGASGALKPSLVEWKHTICGILSIIHINLETFLSGMETDALQRNAVAQESP